MEGLEAMSAEDVSGVGQAAKIIAWMRRECPDLVSVAPLLKELRFTGFSDSRFVRRVVLFFLTKYLKILASSTRGNRSDQIKSDQIGFPVIHDLYRSFAVVVSSTCVVYGSSCWRGWKLRILYDLL